MTNPYAGLLVAAFIIGAVASFHQWSWIPLAVAIGTAIMLKPFLPPPD